MEEKSKFFTNGFTNDSSSASQNMRLKYFACWGIYDIDRFYNSMTVENLNACYLPAFFVQVCWAFFKY